MRHDVTVPVLDKFGAHFWALKDVCIIWLCTSIFCVPGNVACAPVLCMPPCSMYLQSTLIMFEIKGLLTNNFCHT